jgi:hypothetical protein
MSNSQPLQAAGSGTSFAYKSRFRPADPGSGDAAATRACVPNARAETGGQRAIALLGVSSATVNAFHARVPLLGPRGSLS